MLAGPDPISGGGIILAGKELDGPGPDRGIVFSIAVLAALVHRFRERQAGS